MRWSLALLVLVALSRLAFAEPKVAVAPIDGDDGKVSEVLADVVGERAKVTKPGRVEGAMKSMGVGKLSAKSSKKLRNKLDVDVVVYGSLEKDGRVKKLSLTFAGSGKAKLEIEFASEKSLRKELSGKVGKRISSAMEGSGGDDEEDEDDLRAKREAEAEKERKREAEAEKERKREEEARAKKEEEERKKRDDDERAERKKRDDDERKKRDDDEKKAAFRRKGDDDDKRGRRKDSEDEDGGRRKKRVADDDEDGGRRKKRVAEDDEDSGRARKRLRDEDDESDDEDRPRRKKKGEPRHVLTQSALWLDAGGSFARRTFTYASTGTMRPPPVGTAAPAGRIAGELYPAAFSSLGGAAGFGIAGEYSQSFGIGIAVPKTTVTTPIKNVHYAVGARYRFTFGQHSLALGVSYWRQNFMANRKGLMDPDLLDMPDVDYKAVAPGISLRIAAAPNVSAFASVDLPLTLNSGPIQAPTSYGAAKILAFDVLTGAQIVVADHIAVQLAAEVTQVGLKFTGQAGTKSVTRMVSAATDRSIGVAATIGITY